MELFISEFQLLRPEWLLMLIPLLVLAWLFWSKKLFSRDWESVIDPRLLPHLLIGKAGSKSIWPLLLWTTLGMIVVLSLSGPVWKKLPIPVFKQQSALIIILDLSSSMNAQDVKPSRLVRARLKLLDLLKNRKEGQTALVAFAATAYTVSPLTDDTDTIQSLVSSLTTGIMPVQGSRADLGVEKALELFQNAGITRGDILLISDGVTEKSVNRLQVLDFKNYHLSVLAAGTKEGAPIPEPSGGFLKDNKGSIVIAKLEKDKLRTLASSFGGVFNGMTVDDSDLNRLQKIFDSNKTLNDHEQTDFKADRYQEEGPWLLLLVLPLAALVFRRGIFLTLLLCLVILPMPQPVMAQEKPSPLPGWGNLWKNSNQRAEQFFNQGDAENAAQLFDRADWKGASFYKAEKYEQALEQLEQVETPDGKYNRANTLAKMGQLQQALEAYDEVLTLKPEHDDAIYNRKLVEDALKKQQQQQDQDGEKSDKEQSDQDQQQENQQQSDQQNSEQSDQQKEQQSQNENSSKQNSDDQQQDVDKQQQAEKEQQEKQEQSEKDQQAQQQADEKNNESEQAVDDELTEKLSEQAEAQWLRKIPDDPGGLLRNKFKYQYGRQQQPSQEKEPW